MLKKHMTPLTKGGQTVANQGKGSKQAPMGMRQQITQSGATQPGANIGNYAKATPMANPTPPSTTGLGSGTWPGVGE